MNNANKPIHPDPQRGAEQSYSNQEPWKLDSGLTKLEHFSGLAMQALINNTNSPNFIVEKAVELAKLLLIELEKQKP